jgi:hypothetical protein
MQDNPAQTDDDAFPVDDDDELLDTREARKEAKLSHAAFWRNVSSGRLTKPVYPAPRKPMWWKKRLRNRIAQTSALPTEAKEQRRQARLQRERAARLRAETTTEASTKA